MRLTPEQQHEIAGLRGETRPTRRATVPALEEILLQPLPVLDHGFIRVVDYMGDDAAIVQAMITMAKGFDMRVVAEGVETKEQLSYLLNRRCTEMQGFFLGKPLPAPALSEVLRMQH